MVEENSPKRGILDRLYGKHSKLFILIPLLLLVFSIFSISFFYAKTGDIMVKDVTLTGGATLTIFTEEKINAQDLESQLSLQLGDALVRILTDLKTGKQIAFSIESQADIEELITGVESYLGTELKEEDYTAEFTGSTLSESFYKELMTALIIAFILMSLVVFFLFKVLVPSLAVILAALTDIIVTLAAVNLLGIRLSTAGIAAFLMLIGYSVDTDIMLTTRLLKRKEKHLIERVKDSFRTGVTMSLTSFIVVFLAYFVVVSPVLKQVFVILSIGLLVDIIATWCGNAPILKWYCDKKKIS